MALLDEIDIVPDAIVADFQLNDGEDGLTSIRQLRAAYGQIPACIISANRSTDLVMECETANLPLLYKPIDPPMLRDFLQRSSTPPKPRVTGTTRRSVAE